MSSESKGKNAILSVDELAIDTAFQMRDGGLNPEHGQDLAESVKRGTRLPPVKVMAVELADGEARNFVTDGFHTVEAHRIAGRKSISCLVYRGTWEDAQLAAAAANQKHNALKRTHADKRRAVGMALQAAPGWTDRLIAKHCGVNHHLVAEMRQQLGELPPEGAVRVGADGKQYLAKRPPRQREEPSLEGEGWRSMPLAEFLSCGDDELLPTLEQHKCVTAGDLDDALRDNRYPDGSKMRLFDGLRQEMRDELKKLLGYDGTAGEAEEPEDVKPPAGSERVYQWREWDQHFGPLVRSLDVMAAVHPQEKKSEEFKRAKDLLTALANVAKRWRERLAQARE